MAAADGGAAAKRMRIGQGRPASGRCSSKRIV